MRGMSLRKLRAWEDAGLVDAATAARIRDWEAAHASPVAMRAVIGIAVLAIALGLVSVVAANWDAIPVMARLAVHLGLVAACLAALTRHDSDALLFVTGALGLTFLGHVGQAYQSSAPLWVALGMWLLLFSPLLLLRGRGRLIALTLFFVFAWACGLYGLASLEASPPPQPLATHARAAAEFALPVSVAALAAWAIGRGSRRDLWRHLGDLALAYAAVGASIVAIASAVGRWTTGEESQPLLVAVGVLAATGFATAALVLTLRRDALRRTEALVFAGLATVPLLAWLLSGSALRAALLFMALWAGIAFAALKTGRRAVFQSAVALVALRLVVLSFELAKDLLTSGAGLILAGLLMLAVAWAATHISRRFAPPRGTPPAGDTA